MSASKNRRRLLALWLAAALLLAAAAASRAFARTEKRPYYGEMLAAAEHMELCMSRVRDYKAELGLPLSEEDRFATGLIGDYVSPITTTLGAVEAKRTSADSSMAALVVVLLHEAGVRAGQTVGAGFSGSFPGLDLAVLCACRAMDVRCVYIASVGSSTYGANQPELTLPDIVCRLAAEGLVDPPSALTPGGADDAGTDMDQGALDAIQTRLSGYGAAFRTFADYSENISWRMALYEAQGPIVCFIGVGGNLTTIGLDGNRARQGVLRPDRWRVPGPRSGLTDRYSALGLPVIQLLNVKKLIADYGLPYDPETRAPLGESAVFYETRYAPLPAVLGLVGAAAVLLPVYGRRKRGAADDAEL